MIAVYLILYGGISFGFYLIYELLRYQYGDRMVKYLQDQRYRAKVLRDYERIQFEAKENVVQRNEVQEVPLEDYIWDVVTSEGVRTPADLITLEISTPQLLTK